MDKIQKMCEKFQRRMERAEKAGDEKEIMILDMEFEDNEILKLGRISGVVDEEDLW